jgi:hypothetical protein
VLSQEAHGMDKEGSTPAADFGKTTFERRLRNETPN